MSLRPALPFLFGLFTCAASAADLTWDLYEAIVYADVAAARTAIGSGADVNGMYEGQTMLGTAARNGATEMAVLLVEAGADVDLADSKGLTPLLHALAMRDTSMTVALLSAGANPNQQTETGEPVAIVAATRGDLTLAKLLLEAGADLKIADSEGNSPLWLLIRYAPEPMSPELPAADGAGNLVELIEMMGKAGVDLSRGSATQSPLCLARQMGREDAAEALLSAGANPDDCGG